MAPFLTICDPSILSPLGCSTLISPVALQPHGVGFLEPGMQVATIDHSMWFHLPFNINEWLLYSVESTSVSSARGFVRGEFYTQDGTLVASTVQR